MLKSLYQSPSRQATWLELFFDLVFVAVIGVVTHDFAHTHHGHMDPDQFLRFPLVFIPVWWIWATHTLYANRFDTNDRFHRFFALLIMGLLVLLSTYLKEASSQSFTPFVGLYVVNRLLLGFLYLHIHSKCRETVGFAKQMATSIFWGAILCSSAILFEGKLKFTLFYAGIACDMFLQLVLRHQTKQFPVDRKHLVERIGLLVIIILGESVISMISSLSHIKVWDGYALASAITGFSMLWAIWWIYFDSFANLECAKAITDGNVLIYTHLILCMGLIILANLIGHSIKGDLDQKTFQLLAMVGMSGFYFGKQIIYMLCFPPFRKMIVINTLVCISLTVASTYLPRIEFSLIGIALCMLFYVYSTYKWLLPNDIEAYLVKE